MSSVFIIMIIASILGGVVASSKGRSGIGWGFLCFLIPILIIVVLFLPNLKRQAAAAPGVIYDDSADFLKPLRKCPFCAEEIRLEAIYCKHCKKDLPAMEKAVTKE